MANKLCIVWDVDNAIPMTGQPRTYGRAAQIADVLETVFQRNFVVIPAVDVSRRASSNR